MGRQEEQLGALQGDAWAHEVHGDEDECGHLEVHCRGVLEDLRHVDRAVALARIGVRKSRPCMRIIAERLVKAARPAGFA